MTDTAKALATTLEAQSRWQTHLDALTDKHLQNLNRTMGQVQREILHQWGKVGTRTEWSQSRAIALLQEAFAVTEATRQRITDTTATLLGQTSAESAKVHHRILSFKGRAANVKEVALDPKAMATFWTETPVGGRLLKDWIDRSFDHNTKDKIQREIAVGLFKGETYQQLGERFKEGFNMTGNEIDTLVRTYVRSANMDALQKTFEANKDLIKKLRWTASINDQTCLLCASLEGQRYDIGQTPPCPVHPRCRCTLLPDLQSLQSLNIESKEIDQYRNENKMGPEYLRRGYRGRILFEHDGTMAQNFGQWIMKQDQKTQKSMLGPRRLELLQSGLIQFTDLVDLQALRIRPLQELYDRAGTSQKTAAALAATAGATAATQQAPGKASRASLEDQLAALVWRYGELLRRGLLSKKERADLIRRINRIRKQLGQQPITKKDLETGK